jgi:hypothetical protein
VGERVRMAIDIEAHASLFHRGNKVVNIDLTRRVVPHYDHPIVCWGHRQLVLEPCELVVARLRNDILMKPAEDGRNASRQWWVVLGHA